MSEISSLWHSLLAVLDELKAKVDPVFHKSVDEITAKARAAKDAAEKAVAQEKPIVQDAVQATVQVAEKAAETVQGAVAQTGKDA